MVYKRYASLYFVMGIDASDNELITLEVIHHYVEVLDKYFGNVCELDLIFNFHKVPLGSDMLECLIRCAERQHLKLASTALTVQAYWMLDELLISGELQEPSKKVRQLLHCGQGSPACADHVHAGHLKGHRGTGPPHRAGEAWADGDCPRHSRVLMLCCPLCRAIEAVVQGSCMIQTLGQICNRRSTSMHTMNEVRHSVEPFSTIF